MIRGLLDRVEDDPDLSKSDIYNLRTQKSDQFTNIARDDLDNLEPEQDKVEEDKKANFLDLIGQTKALLCEMNLID